MTNQCPKGHNSTDPEFCSECGCRMDPSGPSVLPVQSAAPEPEKCPHCGEPRRAQARFCEGCGYDFTTGVATTVAATIPDAPVRPTLATPSSSTSVTNRAPRCDALVQDPSIPSMTKTYPIDLPELLIGRLRGSTAQPDIALDDELVSKRHAVIRMTPEGLLTIMDTSSTNGTRLNSQPIQPHVLTPIEPGDVVTFGENSKLTIRARD